MTYLRTFAGLNSYFHFKATPINNLIFKYCFSIFLGLLLLVACQSTDDNHRFRYLDARKTGIDFSNQIRTTDSFNILNFHYIYNGGGVGVGDFDNNGLPDLVFSGNQVSSKLYLNQGEMSFLDISEKANFSTERWATGVSIVDINADGWQDIYISVGGVDCTDQSCKSYLFINQKNNKEGIPSFVEAAEKYGLTDGLYTQQAAFFDYDNDGDLDVYLVHNINSTRDKNVPSPKRMIEEDSKDQLFENDGNGQFKDVSEQMNIDHRGYGLGVTINDFNADGRPDIYVANDFLSEDLMYLNTVDSGFQEVSKQYLKHTSYNAMGVDVADVNGDGLPEIMALDMLPETQERKKSMQGFMNYNKFALTQRREYMPQFIRNTLQLHNGFLGNDLLPFSDVSFLSGVYNTDWSWSPLLADFDNDGDRDLFITNGYGKDITDLDFINYTQNISQFGTKAALQEQLNTAINQMKNVEIPNYFFENEGNLKFKNQSKNWVKEINSISNGAIYADLDNDGDLDLVSNNINQKAFVLENKSEGNNYLKIKLKGGKKNLDGIGDYVDVFFNNQRVRQFQSPVRGYLSSVSSTLHFGLGQTGKVDSVVVYTADKVGDFEYPMRYTLKNIPANQLLEIDYLDESWSIAIGPEIQEKNTLFKAVKIKGLNIQHKENYYLDYDFQPLLLKQLSTQGPCLAVANVDGKAGDEIFIGGAKKEPSRIFSQQADGTYKSQVLLDSMSEDTDAAFFDIDRDGDLDLYVVSGGTEFTVDSEYLKDRVYLNDGQGNFSKSDIYSPSAKQSGSVVQTTKYRADLWVFVGGRVVPNQFPKVPISSLMTNHYKNLTQNTEKFAYGLHQIGLVMDAVFSDYDQDGNEDLLVLTDWGTLSIFKNRDGGFKQLKEKELQIFLESDTTDAIVPTGLWTTIVEGDFDGDGDPDYILGNQGENTNLQATFDEPLYLYKGDYDDNGSLDPLVGHAYSAKNGVRENYPLHARDDVVKQLVKVKDRLGSYADFGKATLAEVLPESDLSTDYLTVNYLNSSYLENRGNGKFILRPLPKLAQLAPIQSILVDDFDANGSLDVLLVGNDYGTESTGGQLDAFNGLYLKGDGTGNFKAVSTDQSGFYVPGDGRDVVKMTDKDGQAWIVVGQNAGALKTFRINR